jgi:hypothetical protein
MLLYIGIEYKNSESSDIQYKVSEDMDLEKIFSSTPWGVIHHAVHNERLLIYHIISSHPVAALERDWYRIRNFTFF